MLTCATLLVAMHALLVRCTNTRARYVQSTKTGKWKRCKVNKSADDLKQQIVDCTAKKKKAKKAKKDAAAAPPADEAAEEIAKDEL